jgi:hypothetical protein
MAIIIQISVSFSFEIRLINKLNFNFLDLKKLKEKASREHILNLKKCKKKDKIST